MKISRDEVYAAIDGERDYQDTEFGTEVVLPVASEIELLEDYSDRASWERENQEAALRIVRKVAGIAVRCMENHGAPKR